MLGVAKYLLYFLMPRLLFYVTSKINDASKVFIYTLCGYSKGAKILIFFVPIVISKVYKFVGSTFSFENNHLLCRV